MAELKLIAMIFICGTVSKSKNSDLDIYIQQNPMRETKATPLRKKKEKQYFC